jgi:MFS superfamily sulfate permease-like transporter
MTYVAPPKANIRNIKDIHAELLNHVGSSTRIEIDLDACEDVDVSMIQLVESARKSAAASGKSIALTKPANDAVKATLRRAGLLDVLAQEDAQFWLHKDAQ